MKKLLAFLLAAVMMLGVSGVAVAASFQTGQTTLTCVVPESSFVIHIPEDVTVTYGDTSKHEIGTVYVSDVVGLTSISGHAVFLPLVDDPSNANDSIPVTYIVDYESEIDREVGVVNFNNQYSTTWDAYQVGDETTPDFYETVTLSYKIPSGSWHGLSAGTYTGSINFSFTGY